MSSVQKVDNLIKQVQVQNLNQSPTQQLLDEAKLQKAFDDVMSGPGYSIVPSVFSHEDTEKCYKTVQKIMKEAKIGSNSAQDSDIEHNTYPGLMFGLLRYEADILNKFITNPIMMQISNKILGEKCKLSSLSANTITKGMPAQNPHTDYPYYNNMWPNKNENFAIPKQPMSITFLTAVSDYTPEMGSTAVVPGSQKNWVYPDNVAEFERKCKQVTLKRGDVMVIAGALQHCSRENTTDIPRCALVQQMVPLFVSPFEDFTDFEKFVPKDKIWKKLLALDHPLPKNTYDENTRRVF